MYDDCGKGPGRLTPNAMYSITGSTLAMSPDDCVDIFTAIDINRKGFITTGLLIFFLSKITVIIHSCRVSTHTSRIYLESTSHFSLY